MMGGRLDILWAQYLGAEAWDDCPSCDLGEIVDYEEYDCGVCGGSGRVVASVLTPSRFEMALIRVEAQFLAASGAPHRCR